MTVLAVLVAVVTVLGHRTHTEAISTRPRPATRGTNTRPRRFAPNDTALMTDLLSVVTVTDQNAAAKDRPRATPATRISGLRIWRTKGEARLLKKSKAGGEEGRPLRPRRGAAGDRPGDYLHHAADQKSRLLVRWDGLLGGGHRGDDLRLLLK